MAKTPTSGPAIKLKCICGDTLCLSPEVLGRFLPCPKCRRELRLAVHYVLAELPQAPNLSVQCTCGRLVVTEPGNVGKKVLCKVCNQRLLMPQPIMRPSTGGYIRIPKQVLHKRMRQGQKDEFRRGTERAAPEGMGMRRKIMLRPGESVCVNPRCGELLPAGANVCARCGTNAVTGRHYKGAGPAAAPVGRWREPS